MVAGIEWLAIAILVGKSNQCPTVALTIKMPVTKPVRTMATHSTFSAEDRAVTQYWNPCAVVFSQYSFNTLVAGVLLRGLALAIIFQADEIRRILGW